jgi:DNA-binding response OmpR family regulator
MSERILVIEDDPSILRGLQLNLGMEGYTVRSAMDGETGLRLALTEKPDLIVLDLMLPRLGGLDIVREVRKADPDLPILIVSAKGQEIDKVAGLQLGADDYMVKPFGLKELLARIDALLRRRRARGATGETRTVRKVGTIELDATARRASVEGKALELTSREFDLLEFFVAHPRPRLLARTAHGGGVGLALLRHGAHGRQLRRAPPGAHRRRRRAPAAPRDGARRGVSFQPVKRGKPTGYSLQATA